MYNKTKFKIDNYIFFIVLSEKDCRICMRCFCDVFFKINLISKAYGAAIISHNNAFTHLQMNVVKKRTF